MGALIHELSTFPQLVSDIGPKDFERLIAAVLKGVYECDVVHIGRSSDGGIDVLVFLSDSDPMVVQVKTHQNAAAVESVAVVRDILGAMILADTSRGMVVTTASRFSACATAAAQRAEERGLRLQLVDCACFLDVLKLLVPDDLAVPSWFINQFSLLHDSTFDITDRVLKRKITEAYRAYQKEPLDEAVWARYGP